MIIRRIFAFPIATRALLCQINPDDDPRDVTLNMYLRPRVGEKS